MDGNYQTVEEMLKQGIIFVIDYEGFYYVRVKPTAFYENAIWKVDKKTFEVSYMMFTDFIIDIDNKPGAKQVDPEVLKRTL